MRFFSRLFFPRRDKLDEASGEYLIVVDDPGYNQPLQIGIAREGDEPLAKNEQAFLLNRILTQLT